jgi:hypothetical protein
VQVLPVSAEGEGGGQGEKIVVFVHVLLHFSYTLTQNAQSIHLMHAPPGLELEAAVHGHDAQAHVAVAAVPEAGLLHHGAQLVLLGKPPDALHQVLVGRRVASHHFPDLGDHVEGVCVVCPLHNIVG